MPHLADALVVAYITGNIHDLPVQKANAIEFVCWTVAYPSRFTELHFKTAHVDLVFR